MLRNIFVVLLLASVNVQITAQEVFGQVYEVTATVLILRQEPNAKSRALLKLPRGSLVLNFNDSQQNQSTETIGGKTGRWLRVQGYDKYAIGYVFEGFLKRRKGIGYNDISDSCKITAKLVECGDEDKFTYSPNTPVIGSWYSEPGTEHGGLEYVYLNNSRKLKSMLESPNPKAFWPAGANATMILEGNKVLQFIVVPTPRGFGG
jgi:hypothetical protein